MVEVIKKRSQLANALRCLNSPVDSASLVVFRFGFGAAMLFAALRTWAKGWIAAYYLTPTHFFHFYGFDWVRPWPGHWMYLHFIALAGCALALALGYRQKLSAAGFAVLFCYIHLCDKTHYLNHYYLFTLLALLLAAVPKFSMLGEVPRWTLWLFRFQIAVVYFYGGLGKLESDWLLHAQPLISWLQAKGDMPGLGPLLRYPGTAYLFSIGGALFDLAVVPALLLRRTRAYAYVACLIFHLLTWLLFPIGMFPWVMVVAATLFFNPSWPRRFFGRLSRSRFSDKWIAIKVLPPAASLQPQRGVSGQLSISTAPLVLIYMLIQLLLPLRFLLYPGNVLWTEQGFRFSWRVMLMEKTSSLDVEAIDKNGKIWVAEPRQLLTSDQALQMSTQPDMILEFGHMVADDLAARGLGPAQVHVNATVSLNGRQARLLIDPKVNLASQQDSLKDATWILPLEQ